MMRKLIALLLCICMIGSMTVYAVGDETTPTESTAATEPHVHETTEPTVPETSSEPTIPEASSEATVPEKDDAPAVGDEFYIKSGSLTYKAADENSDSRQVLFSHKANIVSIVANEENTALWYEFEPDGLLLLHKDYRFVKVENTTEETPEESFEPSETVETTEATESVEPETTVAAEPEEDVDVIAPIDPSVYEVQFTGNSAAKLKLFRARPSLEVEVASAEIFHALKSAPATSKRHMTAWRGVYDISAANPMEVIVTGLPAFDNEAIEIRHYLDTEDAIQDAIADKSAKYLSVDGFAEYFADEIAALKAVKKDAADNTICYTVLSSDKGDVTIEALEGGEKRVSFIAQSYSLHDISIVYEQPILYADAASGVINTGTTNDNIESSKSVSYDPDTKTFMLTLETYVTGSSTIITDVITKPTDFVLAMDISHSMPPCINCGTAGVDSKTTGRHTGMHSCTVYAPDMQKTVTYYKDDGNSSSDALTYCSTCDGWFLAKHFAVNKFGRHGTLNSSDEPTDVRYIPFETSADKAVTIAGVDAIVFYENHVCTSTCESECTLKGTRVPVYTIDPGFSTSKTYFSDANVSHTSATYVYEYCTICEKWVKGYHCTGGSEKKPASVAFYESHVCTEECEENCSLVGKRVKVDPTEISTEKTYFTDATVSHTAAKYVIKYHSCCGRWMSDSDNHGHSATAGTVVVPYEQSSYFDTKVIQCYKLCVSRLQAAREAIAAFTAQVQEMSKGPDGVLGTGDDIHHRVAIVGFGGNSTGDDKVGVADYKTITGVSSYTATGIYSLYEPKQNEGFGYYDSTNSYNNFESYHLIKNTKTYPDLAQKCYTNALRDVTNATEYAVLEEGIRELNYNYGTYISYAAIMAEQIFELTDSSATIIVDGKEQQVTRERVAVFFTDGQPDGDGEGVYDLADESIRPAYNIKNHTGYNGTVYSVGIFAKADASKIWHLTSDNASQDEYMHMLSSNYPLSYTFESARKMRDIGATKDRSFTIQDVNPLLLTTDAEGNTIVDTSKGGFYLTAENSADLVNVFKKIASESVEGGANAGVNTLDSKTVTQDMISDKWELRVPDGVQASTVVEAYTMTYTGNDKDGVMQWEKTDSDTNYTPTVHDKLISVTNFDYAANYVGMDKHTDGSVTTEVPRGKKMVIKIPIKPTADNRGGAAQYTNVPNASGVFYDGKPQENYDVPRVDLAMSVTLDKQVINASDEKKFDFDLRFVSDPDNYTGDNGASGNYLQFTEKNSEQKQYQIAARDDTISFENIDPNGHLIITEKDVSDYKVEVSLNGGYSWQELEVDEDGNATIDIDLTVSTAPEQEEPEEPETETPDEGDGTGTESGSTEVPGEGSESDGDGEGSDGEEEPVVPELPDFDRFDIVFRNTRLRADLTITKVIDTANKQPDHSFLFAVTSEESGTNMTVVIPAADFSGGTASVTIKDLPIGRCMDTKCDDENCSGHYNYNVTELTDWSWRYDVKENGINAAIGKNKIVDDKSILFELTLDDETTTFENERKRIYWLSGDSWCRNWWGKLNEFTRSPRS